jgi:hypothetical protein
MFLNQRSPLCLRVKSKKAELFFLNKEDAINISTSYPQYWKKINKKSLFNMEQIKRLINKIIKIISTDQDFNPLRKYSKSNDENGNFKSIYEDDLQTIPSFSHESNFTESDNDDEKSINRYENNDNGYEHYYNSINNLHTDKNYEINQNDVVLNTISEDNIKELQSSNENNSLLSEEINETKKIINFDSNINHSKINSTYRFKSFLTSLTPYKYEEINNEIYPDETFIISPQSNPNYKFTYNHLKKNNLDNISICSTEISFSINSEYENIDELSDGNYSKDISFRITIKNFIQDEVKRKNNFKNNVISHDENENNNSINIKNKVSNDLVIKKKSSYIPRRSSNFSLNHIKQSRTRNNFFKIKTNDSSNNNTLKIDLNDKGEENKTKNKNYMLSVISQNIEKDNLNLNNPELFYSGIFMKFMDKKMITNNEKNNNNEINNTENEFIRKITSFQSNQFDN